MVLLFVVCLLCVVVLTFGCAGWMFCLRWVLLLIVVLVAVLFIAATGLVFVVSWVCLFGCCDRFGVGGGLFVYICVAWCVVGSGLAFGSIRCVRLCAVPFGFGVLLGVDLTCLVLVGCGVLRLRLVSFGVCLLLDVGCVFVWYLCCMVWHGCCCFVLAFAVFAYCLFWFACFTVIALVGWYGCLFVLLFGGWGWLLLCC